MACGLSVPGEFIACEVEFLAHGVYLAAKALTYGRSLVLAFQPGQVLLLPRCEDLLGIWRFLGVPEAATDITSYLLEYIERQKVLDIDGHFTYIFSSLLRFLAGLFLWKKLFKNKPMIILTKDGTLSKLKMIIPPSKKTNW